MNWLTGEDISLEDIRRSIATETLKQAPSIDKVPVHKSLSTVQILSQKAATDELTPDEEKLMLEVFQGAFQLDQD